MQLQTLNFLNQNHILTFKFKKNEKSRPKTTATTRRRRSLMNKTTVNKIAVLSTLIFLVGTFIYIIKCPTRIILKENPLIIQYPNGTTTFWELYYIVTYIFMLGILICLIYYIQSRWVKIILKLTFGLISFMLIYSSILMFQNIHKYDILAYSGFWCCFLLGLIFLILWIIKYLKK